MKSAAIWTCCRLSSQTPPAGACISVGPPRDPTAGATFCCAAWRRKRRLTAFSRPSRRATTTRRSRRPKLPVNTLWCGSRIARERPISIAGLSICSRELMHTGEVALQFDSGTLTLEGAGQEFSAPSVFQWDERVRRWRAPAIAYRQAVTELTRQDLAFKDEARRYYEFQFRTDLNVEPRPYQRDAIAAWQKGGKRGVVILPTGAGKSFVAQMAIEMTGRSALVVVPTLDLMNQWYDLLVSSFQAEIGLIGGGYFEQGAIVVTTYASAFRFMERMGNQFGLLVCDECHHLPGSGYPYVAEMAIAPFRLGLTATPVRSDGGEELMTGLLGPIIYRLEAQQLAGEFLADYDVVRLTVQLSGEDQERYEKERAIFRRFIASQVLISAVCKAGKCSSFRARAVKRDAARCRLTANRNASRSAPRPNWRR